MLPSLCGCNSPLRLYWFRFSNSAGRPVSILTHTRPTRHGSVSVVTKVALIRPSLSHGLQLRVPDKLLHVASTWLTYLLPPRNPPPQLIVLVKDVLLGCISQLTKHCLGGTVIRWTLENIAVLVKNKTYWTYWIFAHCVLRVRGAKFFIAWNICSSRNCCCRPFSCALTSSIASFFLTNITIGIANDIIFTIPGSWWRSRNINYLVDLIVDLVVWIRGVSLPPIFKIPGRSITPSPGTIDINSSNVSSEWYITIPEIVEKVVGLDIMDRCKMTSLADTCYVWRCSCNSSPIEEGSITFTSMREVCEAFWTGVCCRSCALFTWNKLSLITN